MIQAIIFIKKIGFSLIGLTKIIIQSHWSNIKLPVFSDKEELVVLGNGPSLKINLERDLNFFKSKRKFCVNGFSLSKFYSTIKPDFYLLADNAFWTDNPSTRISDFRNNVISSIIESTTWSLTVFLPFESQKNKNLISSFKDNKNIKIVYFNKTSINGFEFFNNWCFKFGLAIPRAQNVLIPSIMLGINMKFKTIYLIGADHSWHEQYIIDNNNNLCLKDKHFYDINPIMVPLLDTMGNKQFIHQQFESLVIAFKMYHVIKKYAIYMKTQIYNASEISFIDAFDRIKINDNGQSNQ